MIDYRFGYTQHVEVKIFNTFQIGSRTAILNKIIYVYKFNDYFFFYESKNY